MKSTITRILISILAVIILSTCQRKKDPCGNHPGESYTNFNADEKDIVPYYKDEFDTLGFVSNKGDTAIFRRVNLDSSYYCKYIYDNIECLPNAYCYQVYEFIYFPIRGSSTLKIKYGRQMQIEIDSPNTSYDYYQNTVEINFDDLHIIFTTDALDKPHNGQYIGDTLINNRLYKTATFIFHEFYSKTIGRGCVNSEYGLFSVQNYKSGKNWFLYKP